MSFNITAKKLEWYHRKAKQHDKANCMFCDQDFERIAKHFEDNGLEVNSFGNNHINIKLKTPGEYHYPGYKENEEAYNLIILADKKSS